MKTKTSGRGSPWPAWTCPRAALSPLESVCSCIATQKLVDAPASALEERRALEKRAGERARSALAMLDASLPPGEPCSDVRLGFAVKVAAALRDAGVVRGWSTMGLAGELTRTKSCPQWASLALDR